MVQRNLASEVCAVEDPLEERPNRSCGGTARIVSMNIDSSSLMAPSGRGAACWWDWATVATNR